MVLAANQMHSLSFLPRLVHISLSNVIFLVVVRPLRVVSYGLPVYHLLLQCLLLQWTYSVGLHWSVHWLFRAALYVLTSLAWFNGSLVFLSTYSHPLNLILSHQCWSWYLKVILILAFKFDLFINGCWLMRCLCVRPLWLLLLRFALFLLNIWRINVFSLQRQ